MKQEIKLRSHRGHVETSAGHLEPGASRATGEPPSTVGAQGVPVGALGGSSVTEDNRNTTTGQSELGASPRAVPNPAGKVRLSPAARQAYENRKAGLPPPDGLSPDRRAWLEAQWEKVGGRPARLSRTEWEAAHPIGPSKAERTRAASRRFDKQDDYRRRR